MKTVKDMYNALTSGQKLLSDYSADFWNEYKNNSARYDKLFVRLYRSFKYFLQDDDETINEVVTDFVADVYNHLMINDKKYSELYRVYVVSDDDYSLLNNYNVTEIMDKDTSDTGDITTGAQNNTSTDKIAPYDSSSFNNLAESINNFGSRIDNRNLASTEDYTLTRVGNIGVQTGADMLSKHSDYWKTYKFYEMIFKDIATELLIV